MCGVPIESIVEFILMFIGICTVSIFFGVLFYRLLCWVWPIESRRIYTECNEPQTTTER